MKISIKALVVSVALTVLARLAWSQKARNQGYLGDTTSPACCHAWPCTRSPESLPHLNEMIELLMNEATPDSVVNLYTSELLKARGINITSRNTIKVREIKPGLRRVSVSTSKPFALQYQRLAAEACWVTSKTIGYEK